MAAETATQQHVVALGEAQRVRLARAETRAKVHAGRLQQDGRDILADMLERDVPWELKTAALGTVLTWPKHSQITTRRNLVAACGASETRRLGELTYRQRVALVNALRGE
jgi:hypothetical protein